MTAAISPKRDQAEIEKICGLTLAEAREVLAEEPVFREDDDILDSVSADREILDVMTSRLHWKAMGEVNRDESSLRLEERQKIAAAFEEEWESLGFSVPRRSALTALLEIANRLQNALQDLADLHEAVSRYENARHLVGEFGGAEATDQP